MTRQEPHHGESAGAEGASDGAHNGTTRVALHGQIDLARRAEVAEALAPLRAATGDVVVDLTAVSFMDSSGLSALATLASDLAPAGRTVTCLGAQRPVERLIRLAGIDTVVELR